MEVDSNIVIQRIEEELKYAEKALENAKINLVRLERERQAWLAMERALQTATGVVSSGPVNLNHIGHSPAICTCPPVQFWDNYKGEPLQLAPCAVHGTNWVRF